MKLEIVSTWELMGQNLTIYRTHICVKVWFNLTDISSHYGVETGWMEQLAILSTRAETAI